MRFSIVTPSFNQGRYLETCIRSVLAQGMPDLEYLVLDGGSSDGSVEIIRRYADRLAYWRSRSDGGHMHAVQEGFERSNGEIMGWLNSDDRLAPWALRTAETVFTTFPQVDWITTRFPMMMDERGVATRMRRVDGFNPKAFFRGRNAFLRPGFFSGYVQQESTFWRRRLWEKAGARVDVDLRVAGDFELWSRFFPLADLYAVAVPLGVFRFQSAAFTANEMDAYLEVCRKVLAQQGAPPPSAAECRLRRIIRQLPRRTWRFSGMAYPAPIISHTGRNGRWFITRDWFV